MPQTTTFNTVMMPKAKTETFKLYVEVEGTLELQGRGWPTHTINGNQDVEVVMDVLGKTDIVRKNSKEQQEVEMYLRKESKLGKLLFDAWVTKNQDKLNGLTMVQKFEFVDVASPESSCLARKFTDCSVQVKDFMAEADDYVKFAITIYYSNDLTMGSMTKTDGEMITFVPEA